MPAVTDFSTNNAIVGNGTTTTSTISLYGNDLVGLLIPSAWDGGNITIQGCDTQTGTFVDVYDSIGNIVTLTVGGSSRIVGITGSFLQAIANIPFIKLKTALTVGADRTVIVLSKG